MDEDNLQPENGQDVQNQPVSTESVPEAAQAASVEPTDKWETDKRWGSMWKDHNDTRKSYREIESKFGEVSKKVKDYEAQLEELSQFKTRYEPYEQAIRFIDHLASHPQYAPRLQEFVNSITDNMKRDRFGDLPDNVIQKFEELDELKKWKATQEYNREVETIKSQYTAKISEIEQFAKEKNLSVDMNEFISFCAQNSIAPSQMKGAFLEMAYPQIEETIRGTSQSAAIQAMQKSRAASVPANNRTSSIQSKQSADEEILAAFRKTGG